MQKDNEVILIDNVNVAGCEHYTTMEDCDGIHDLCEQLDDYCSTKKECYYKQLKRLEQKYNEVLKLAKEGMDAQEYCLQEDEEIIGKLQKENEELKKELEPFKDEYFLGLSSGQIAELAKKSIRLTTYNRELEKENETLKRTCQDWGNTVTQVRAENEELKEKNIELQIVSNEIDRLNKYRHALEEIRRICKCSKEMNCEECPQCDDCEELCTTDENLQDILIDKINKVLESEVENE